MSKRLLILSFLIIASSASFVCAKMIESAKPRQQARERIEKIQARVNELDAKLNLNDEQKKKITGILTKAKEATAKILEDVGDQITQLKANAETEIEGVLTKQQFEKYKEVPAEKDDDNVLKIYKGKY
jgi:F0F1-type ATP synthase membrane subunit b/b'